jgi:flagellar protein FlaG
MNIDSVGGPTTSVQPSELSGGVTTERRARPPASGSSTAPNGIQPAPEELKRISADMQRKANSVTTELHFAVDQSTGRTVIRVTDRATQQLIRQIPTEEVAAIIKQINNFQQHMLIDQKV